MYAEKLITATSENFCPGDDEENQALVDFASERYECRKHMALIYGDFYFFKAVCELDEML